MPQCSRCFRDFSVEMLTGFISIGIKGNEKHHRMTSRNPQQRHIKMNDQTLTETDLAYFTGTTKWYRHSLITTVVYTDGVQFMAERGKAYWLIHEIATSQMIKHVHQEPFQVWILKVQEQSGTLTCENGNDQIVYVKKIPYTDFPLPEIKFYFVDNVMMLPSEY